MPLTKSFRQTVVERVQSDPDFRREMLRHALELMLAGDVATGKHLLRDYINATVGFLAIARDLNLSPKGIQRMLGPSGNPQTNNFFRILAYLQAKEGFRLEVHAA